MNARRLANIIVKNYSLSEIEERFDLPIEDLRDCIEVFCEDNTDEVVAVLREDLFFGD